MEKSAGVWKPRVRFPCCWTISKAAISSKFFSSLNPDRCFDDGIFFFSFFLTSYLLINSKMRVFYMNINISTGSFEKLIRHLNIFWFLIQLSFRIFKNSKKWKQWDRYIISWAIGSYCVYTKFVIFVSIIGYNWTSYQSTKRSKFISRLSENLVYSLCNLLTFATDKILYVTYALDAINRANWND